jgi:hypothetical protein
MVLLRPLNMTYPPTATPRIVKRHYGMVRKVLDTKQAQVFEYTGKEGLAYSTWLTRTRDIIRALRTHHYPECLIDEKDMEHLAKLRVKALPNSLAIGTLEQLRTLDTEEPVELSAMSTSLSPKSISHIVGLIEAETLEGYTFKNLTPSDIQPYLSDTLSILPSPEGVTVYK